jgi:H2-forming N5,N10-methylenetetrahydromethanopterin dehydrogenase-like enzyme
MAVVAPALAGAALKGATLGSTVGGALKETIGDLAPYAAAELLKGVSPYVRSRRQLDKAAKASLDRDVYAREAVRRARQTMAPAYELKAMESRLKSVSPSAFVKATAGKRSPEQDEQLQKLFSGALQASFEQSGKEREADIERVEGRAAADAEKIGQFAQKGTQLFQENLKKDKLEKMGIGEDEIERLSNILTKLKESESDTTATS